jgi:hypothetical protein
MYWSIQGKNLNEVAMPTKKHGVIIETPTEARQAERGPSILWMLLASTCLAILLLGVAWLVFFHP